MCVYSYIHICINTYIHIRVFVRFVCACVAGCWGGCRLYHVGLDQVIARRQTTYSRNTSDYFDKYKDGYICIYIYAQILSVCM